MNELNRETELLINIAMKSGVVNAGYQSKTEMEQFLNTFELKQDVERLAALKIDTISEGINSDEIDRIEASIIDKAKTTLEKRGIDVPDLLSEREKEQEIVKALEGLGFETKDAQNVINAGGVESIERDGQNVTLHLKDSPEIAKMLEENNIITEKTDKGLKIKGNLVVQEGFDVENTAKNKKFLQDNEITYLEQAEKQRTLFVPLKAKKIASLVIASAIVGPVPALAIQIILNQTGLLNKMLDKHLISNAQKKALQAGATIRATQKVNGKDVEQFMYVDQKTGGINRVNVNEVRLPNKINGMALSPDQMNSLKNGKTIDFVSDNTHMGARINLKEQSGVQMMYKEMKSDKEYLPVPKVDSAEGDQLRYLGIKGINAVNEIFGTAGKEVEKENFLEKFDLKNDYSGAMNIAKSGTSANMIAAEFNKFKEKAGAVMDLVLSEEEGQGKGLKR